MWWTNHHSSQGRLRYCSTQVRVPNPIVRWTLEAKMSEVSEFFSPCERCGTLCGRDPDGLEVRHVLPCGRECELTAPSDFSSSQTCSGWCSQCRYIATGCHGLSHPCGTPGCTQCGTHASDNHGVICGWQPPHCRVAWTWDKVTCAKCLKLKDTA